MARQIGRAAGGSLSGSRWNSAASRNQLAAETAACVCALVNPALKVRNGMGDCPPTKARSYQNIHYGAPSWPCVTEPITAHSGGYVRHAAHPSDPRVGSGAGAVALSGVRSRSHFSPGFPCGPLHCGDHGQVLRFQPPPHRTVRAVLPHTAHRRRSPPAFGLARQSRKGLGSTTIPDKVISPSWSGDWKATTDQPNPRDRRLRLPMNSASRIRA